jgi:hypothetical protein
MINAFNNKQNRFNDKSSITSYVIEKNTKIKSNSEINEYRNTIYYPFASKE